MSEGGRKDKTIIVRFSLTGVNLFIAQTVVLGAVILNGNWFVFRPCRSITQTIRLPFQVCVIRAIVPVLKTISNALKFSCLLLFDFWFFFFGKYLYGRGTVSSSNSPGFRRAHQRASGASSGKRVITPASATAAPFQRAAAERRCARPEQSSRACL